MIYSSTLFELCTRGRLVILHCYKNIYAYVHVLVLLFNVLDVLFNVFYTFSKIIKQFSHIFNHHAVYTMH